MLIDPSLDPATIHRGELDTLVSDLVAAGFRPLAGDRHNWVGPIHPALRRLTPATEMRIEIRDGWPYLHPYLHVEGLLGRRHVSAAGNACLWLEDDDSYPDWLRLEPILARIEAWVSDQESGAAGPALDAHLYFGGGAGPLLTVDIEGLLERGLVRRVDGASGLLHASFTHDVFSIGARGNLEAAWFWRSGINSPPANTPALRNALTQAQRRLYDRVVATVTRSRSGAILLLWEDSGSINALGVRLHSASGGRYKSTALEVARTDQSLLRVRSGPDAPTLAGRTVAVFGIGAIGSEIALLLARSGVGRLVLIDGERLRPANLSRHAAAARYIGKHKADAMAATIRETFSDVRIVTSNVLLWRPAQIEAIVTASDLVIDATGNRAYGDLLSRIAAEVSTPIVSAALHRAGSIARVRAQVGSGRALWARSPEDGFPEIPAALVVPQPPTWETGCGSPVNNAPPVSVAGAAALASRIALDVLIGRDRREREVFEVYEPIEATPFDQKGLLSFDLST